MQNIQKDTREHDRVTIVHLSNNVVLLYNYYFIKMIFHRIILFFS